MSSEHIVPPFLSKGSTVAIIAPAGRLKQKLDKEIEFLSQLGLKVLLGKNLYNSHNTFAGTDEERLSDLQWAIASPDIDAILCARGGYGTSRIIDRLDLSPLRTSPKWIVGYSDITALLCKTRRSGVECLHATMPIHYLQGGKHSQSRDILFRTLFGDLPDFTSPPCPFNVEGNAEGIIMGGNLSVLSHQIGTDSDFNPEKRLLFIEEVGEYHYHIDRMLTHLYRFGKLEGLSALIIGQFSDLKENTQEFGQDVAEIVLEKVSQYGYPVVFEFPVGHVAQNFPMICGRKAFLEVSKKGSHLSYSNVKSSVS